MICLSTHEPILVWIRGPVKGLNHTEHRHGRENALLNTTAFVKSLLLHFIAWDISLELQADSLMLSVNYLVYLMAIKKKNQTNQVQWSLFKTGQNLN